MRSNEISLEKRLTFSTHSGLAKENIVIYDRSHDVKRIVVV